MSRLADMRSKKAVTTSLEVSQGFYRGGLMDLLGVIFTAKK